jgi:hypothetical protein
MKQQPMKLIKAATQAQSKVLTCVAAMSFFGAAICANAQLLNGTLDPTFYTSPPLYVQTVNTGFGNSAGGGDATGSELDAVYTKVSGGNLYLFIAGCYQDNGNHLNVFIAGGGSGQNTLNVSPSTEATMNGSIFPVGFNATYMIDVNDSSGTLYCDGFPLPNGSQATQAYLGANPLTGGIGTATLGGITFALNNTLTSTMGGANTNLSGSCVGSCVTTGLEIVIPLSDINYVAGSVNVLIDINGGGDGYLSNQFLPGLTPPPQSNLGGSVFNFGPVPLPTNSITFQLDMSEQVSFGNFTNTDPNTLLPVNSLAVGGLNGDWGTDHQLTNYTILNPGDLNPGLKTNLYIGTLPLVGNLPQTISWKYRVNSLDGGYEQPASTLGQNRTTVITNANQVLPKLYYDDLGLGDLTLTPITVKFSLYMAPGTLDDTGYAFNPTAATPDQMYISGAYWGWPTWGYNALPSSQQLFLSSVPNVYTNSFVLPRGTSIYMNYKYSINGLDDENNLNANPNHFRLIRTDGTNYSFPQDVWSWTLTNGTASSTNMFIAGLPTSPTNIVEIDFGNLKIGAPVSGNLPITWVGRPAVQLQSKSSLTSGLWTSYGGTDSAMSTNWPASGSGQFFRLIKN